MGCSDHRHDKLLKILGKRITYFSGCFSLHKSMKEIQLYFERHFRENVKDDGFKLKPFTSSSGLFVDLSAKI